MSNYKKELVLAFANKVKSYDYDVYLAESGEYGFWVANDRILDFQLDFTMIKISGNYRTRKPFESNKIGTGWRITEDSFDDSREGIAKISATNAPRWAVGDVEFEYVTFDKHMLKYQNSSKYKLI